MKEFIKYFPGDLIEIIDAKDQSLYIKKQVGKIGLVERNLTLGESVSSRNMYKVWVEDIILHLHALDMKLISR